MRAWNAIMWAGGPAMPSPGDPQAEPTIGNAVDGGYDLLERSAIAATLRGLTHPAETPNWKLEAALYCLPCSEGRHYGRRQRAHIIGLTYARPDLEPAKAKRR